MLAIVPRYSELLFGDDAQHVFGALGENLEDMPVGAEHHIPDARDELVPDAVLEQNPTWN